MKPKKLPRGSSTIRIHFYQEMYQTIMDDEKKFRAYIDECIQKHPELFPKRIAEGYELHSKTAPSAKLGIQQRRIKILATGDVYSISPSFVMPYMTGFISDVEIALFFQRFAVPFWALTYGFGRNDMYWYRMVTAFGRYSIVGTTVKRSESLPKDLVADEKHTSLKGQRIYAALTAGEGCLLGASVCQSAGEHALTQGYGKFADEAKNVDPDYQADTTNTDGWQATGNAWKKLFPSVTIIKCFLHAFINIRDRAKKKYRDLFNEIAEAVWNTYRAENKRSFSQRIRRLREKALEKIKEGIILEKVLSLCDKAPNFAQAYDHPNAHRTSNMVDRLMRWLDRYAFNMQYFHGTLASAEQGIRAWAILRNYQPYCSRTVGSTTELVCAATELNGFRYCDNWLENLLIATSMGGYRQ